LLESNYKSFNTLEKVNGIFVVTERMKINLGYAFTKMGMGKAEIEDFYKNLTKGIALLKDKDKRKDYRETKLSNFSNSSFSNSSNNSRAEPTEAEKDLMDKLDRTQLECMMLQDEANQKMEDDYSEDEDFDDDGSDSN
jgi:hypothetical protein